MRAVTRLTASALPRAQQCIGSAVLPAIPESGEYADTGTAIDKYIQRAKTGDAAALSGVPAELRPYCAALPLDRIPAPAQGVVDALCVDRNRCIRGDGRCPAAEGVAQQGLVQPDAQPLAALPLWDAGLGDAERAIGVRLCRDEGVRPVVCRDGVHLAIIILVGGHLDLAQAEELSLIHISEPTRPY